MANYKTVTLDSDERRNVAVDGSTVHSNVLYDCTNPGAGVTFRLFDQATIRNVGIKGRNQAEAFTFRVGGGSTDVTVDKVYSENFVVSGPGSEEGGFIFTKNSGGNITIRGATIKGYGNNGLYASKSDSNVTVEDCYFYNNRTSGIRLGGNYHNNGRTHVARNCTVVVDDLSNVALYPSGGHRVGLMISRWGSPEFRNCDVWLKPSANPRSNWCTVRADENTGIAVARVFDSQVQPQGSRLCGDVRLSNVGTSPTDQAPSYAPLSAVEAASAGTDDAQLMASMSFTTISGRTVRFDGSGSSGSIARYDWEFGDGATESTSGPTVEHTYGSDGQYSATLTVVGGSGATDSETKRVGVDTGGGSGDDALSGAVSSFAGLALSWAIKRRFLDG